VLHAAGFLEHTELDLDSRAPQATHARPRNIRMRVSVPDKYTPNTRFQDRVRAGIRTPRPAAGFERDRERCAAQALDPKATLRAFESHDLGVGPADGARCSATQYAITAKNHGANRRIRIGTPRYPARCAECDLHRRFGCHFGCSIDSKNSR
jgi:hypothetical protein